MKNVFGKLARIVDDWVPAHAAERQPLHLERDAPARLRALWAAIGRSPVLAGDPVFEVVPLRETGRRLMEEICGEWFRYPDARAAWQVEKGAPGLPALLPTRFRVMSAGDFDIEITDESAGADDAPVVAIDNLHPKPRLEHPSVVRYTITALLAFAAGRGIVRQMPRTFDGPRPLAPYFPELQQVAGDIWMVEGYHYERSSLPGFLRFASYDSYCDHVHGEPDERFVAYGTPPSHHFDVVGMELELPGFRVVRQAGARCALGKVGDAWIWVKHSGKKESCIFVNADPRQREFVAAWIRKQKGRIRQQLDPQFGRPPKGDYAWDYTQPEHPPRPDLVLPKAEKPQPPPLELRPTTRVRRLSPEEEAIRTEAEALRGLLEKNEPKWRASWRPVRLGPSEPAHVRVFWETLGWSNLLAAELAEPERAAGKVRVKELLADYRAFSEKFLLKPKDLPRRHRLVSVDEQGVGFAITDESRPVPDPPVLCVLSEDGRILPERESYVRFAAALALLYALRTWRASPHRGKVPAGRRPFPRLVPEAREMADGRWLVPDPIGEQLLELVRE